MTYLITGATGEVGSRVVRQLLERHIRPRVLVRSEEKARSLFGDRVDVCVGDLAAPDSMRGAIQGADTVFLVNVGPVIPERDKAAATISKEVGVRKIEEDRRKMSEVMRRVWAAKKVRRAASVEWHKRRP